MRDCPTSFLCFFFPSFPPSFGHPLTVFFLCFSFWSVVVSLSPSLFQVDPSGSYWAWKASAIGKNSTNAKTFLEKRYNKDMELEDAINTAILTLKEGFEGAITEENIEIAVIGTDKKFRVLSEQEVRDYVKEVE
jgi:20S proteasome subunit alpha 2